ncbi:hypothetical protein AVO46_18020 [Vibrio cholerae]|nr:hypothetical protein AVO46_18020 [Vibrio cholerae]
MLGGCTNDFADGMAERGIGGSFKQQRATQEGCVRRRRVMGQEPFQFESRAVSFPGVPQLAFRPPAHGRSTHPVHHNNGRNTWDSLVQFGETAHQPWDPDRIGGATA